VMDVGSQWIVALCRPSAGWAGARAVDVCAGAAGKTVALADAVGAGGQVSAGDASARRLREGKERVRDYGLRNVTFPAVLPVEQADVVLVDAPCSGVGSLPREPDQKWKLTAKKVAEFQQTQRGILDGLAGRVKVGSVLVYATCSLLRDEDEAVVEGFLGAHPEFELESAAAVLGENSQPVCVGPFLKVFPHRVAGGGFFGARMRRKG
jgi:16S rRNA (cytosine967-C5)-methyltransferase